MTSLGVLIALLGAPVAAATCLAALIDFFKRVAR